MPTLKLNLDDLSVETFSPAKAEVAVPVLGATGSHCSAIDACPTRLCDTTRC